MFAEYDDRWDDRDDSDTDFAETRHELETHEPTEDLDRADRLEVEELARLCQWVPFNPSTESRREYGARVLQHVLAFTITGPLSDDDLELALHTIKLTYPAPGLSDAALMALRRTEDHIAFILRARAKELASTSTAPQETHAASSPTPLSDRPNQGPMAPLSPRPLTNPPAPSQAIPDLAF